MKKPRTPRSVKMSPSQVTGKSGKRRKGGVPVEAQVLEGLKQLNLHAAGIDIGSAENYIAVPGQAVKAGEPMVRCFGIPAA